MLDVCLLGTAGMMPLPNRWLTALSLKYNGSNILIDCGEGTQIAMKEAGINFKPIDILCITHFHADHISGLPSKKNTATVSFFTVWAIFMKCSLMMR